MTAPVSVCMIVRDEEHQLGTCLGSLRPFVKEIVVVDTGSEDKTLEVARRHADVVETFTACNDPQGRMLRFDLARNRSFSLATQPWVMWVDADDVVVGTKHLEPLIRKFDAERRGEPSMVMMPYEYSHDSNGRVELLLERERLVTPKENFEWRKWVHEVLSPKGSDVRQKTDAIKVIHRRSASRKKHESGRNLRILEAQHAAEGDGDARDLYYLGQELGYAGRVDEAISFLSKHIDRSGWDDERYMSAQLIAKHHENRSEYEKAIEWAMKAILIREDWGEAYFTVARCAYFIAQKTNSLRWWQRAAHFARAGLDKPPTQTSLFVNPLERDFEIHKYLNMALSKIGDTKGALASVGKGLSVRPDDEHLLFNKRVYEEYEATEEFKRALDRLASVGKITREVRDHLQAAADRNSIPARTNGAHISTKKNGLRDSRKGKNFPPLDLGRLDVVIYVGHSLEAWNPETFKRGGLGGSETAAIEVGKRLAGLGHRVRVFGDCVRAGSPSLEGTFDGVEYLHHDKFKDVACDVFVSSRRPEAVDAPDLEYRCAILWVHDVHYDDRLTPGRADKFDVIWTLSEWHRAFFASKYTFLDQNSPSSTGGKLRITRNGIDLRRFDKTFERDPRRAIYSSSPDRGLQVALETWPEIRARVPGAELHVFYGFNNWEPFADEGQQKVIAHLKKLLAETEGVRFHGRQPQERLAEEFLRSGVWVYPTWFHETSCCHPDSMIAMPGDHSGSGYPHKRIADLVGKKDFPVYCYDEKENRFRIGTATKVWQTKIANELVDVELDDGERLRLTPDHLVMNFDREWVQAGNLRPGDRLLALHYRYNVMIQDADGRWEPESRLVAEWKLGRYPNSDEHVDHLDPLRLDNSPDMLQVLSASEHARKTHSGKKQSKIHERARMAGFREYLKTADKSKLSANGSKAGHGLWRWVNSLPAKERKAWLEARLARKRATIVERMKDPTYAKAWTERARKAGKKGADVRWSNSSDNHKVVSVRRITGEIPVYDMTVKDHHNFIADGVVVHNCITAMEAQAAGLRIVTSPIGALNETVGSRGTMIPGNWLSTSYKAKYVSAVTEAMLKSGDEDRRILQGYAREHFGWDDLAKEWESTFRALLTEKGNDEEVIAEEAIAAPPASAAKSPSPRPGSGSSIVHCVLTDYVTCGVLMDVRDPLSENMGGGCRAAFLGLVKQLPKYGHTVRAFSTFKESLVMDGVEYLPLSEFGNRGQPNVVWALYDTRPLGSQAGVFRIGSHHTYHPIAPFTHIDVNTIPCQAALDHMKPYWAPWSIWEVLPNAINPVPDWKPVPGRVVYHTSPDRGLHKLAEIWPEIRARVPGATLHIIGRVSEWISGHLGGYGSENSESAKRARALEQNLVKARQAGGVEFFRDLPRAQLLDELSQASVFAFPCTVLLPCETFSASAMECCKIGVPVVMTPQDALESIYKGHVLMVPPPIEKNLGMFADAVVQVLVDPIVRQRYSKLGRQLAKGYTYERSGAVLSRIICEHTGFVPRIPNEGPKDRDLVEGEAQAQESAS